MRRSYLRGLPESTLRLVERLEQIGLSAKTIHGLFVAIGIYAGAPRTKDEIETLFAALDPLLPFDRTKNIDEMVGHIYDGYDRQLNEFCYRLDARFEFRDVHVPKANFTSQIVKLRDEGVLNCTVKSVDKLGDATRLFQAFFDSLGEATFRRDVSLVDAFRCGVFQMQLHAHIDMYGAQQIAEAIRAFVPLVFGATCRAVWGGTVDYFVGLEKGQIPLLALMQSMEDEYAKQMWGFQSALFFHDHQRIDEVEHLNLRQWHGWVINRARAWSEAFPSQLLPLSKSGVELSGVLSWGQEVEDFVSCDAFIENGWHYSADTIASPIEELEYKALVVHAVYSSLTATRETYH